MIKPEAGEFRIFVYMPGSNSNWSRLLKETGKALSAIAIFGLIVFCLYSRFARDPQDFEGTIVDKWVNIAETRQGSFNYPTILVKTDKGAQIKISVDNETYERAHVGNRLARNSGGIVIINAQPETNK